MPRYRILRRPRPEDPSLSIFDVEERYSLTDQEGVVIASYWSFMDRFYTLQDATEYVERLIETAEVCAEYK